MSMVILCADIVTRSYLRVYFFEQSKDIRGGYDAQAKEYMADFYGVANSLTMVQCSFLSHLPDIGIITYLYITAIHSIFWIFNVRKDPLKDCDCSTMTHPHPMVRMGYFFWTYRE